MVTHPMKCDSAEDRVGDVETGQRRGVGAYERDASPEWTQMLARAAQHVRRAIDRDDPAQRQPFEQAGCEAARAAAHIDYELVANQRQTIQYGRAPGDLRVGHAVVHLGIPLAPLETFTWWHRAGWLLGKLVRRSPAGHCAADQGGVMPFIRAYAMDCPTCSPACVAIKI